MISDLITSSLLIICIVILRAILGNHISQRLKYAIWLIVAIKLLIPMPALSHEMSVMNYVETTPVYIEKIKPIDSQKAVVIVNDGQLKKEISLTLIQHIGSYVILTVFIISYLVFYMCLKKDRKLLYKDSLSIYQSHFVDSPCVFGMIPAIYVTAETNNSYVIAHEKTHVKHLDFIWVFVRILCVILYWYNPFVYVAAYLSKIDCELACDEATIQYLGEKNRKAYGKALLDSISQKNGLLYVVSSKGGKREMKKRIKMIIKKPKKYILNGLICMMGLILIFVWTLSAKPQSETQVKNNDDYLTVVQDIMPSFISEKLLYIYEDKNNNVLSLSDVQGNPSGKSTLQFDIYQNKNQIYYFRCEMNVFILLQSLDNRVDEVEAKEIVTEFSRQLLNKKVHLKLDKTLTDEISYAFVDQEKNAYKVNKMYGYLEEYEQHSQQIELTSTQKKELLTKCQKIMPQEIIDEINKNGYIYTMSNSNTISIANSKEDPTLRLDFTYDENNHLIQYVSKEYGFVDNLAYHDILYQDDYYEKIVKEFGETFLNHQIKIQQTELPARYSGTNYYRAYLDNEGGIYVFNLGLKFVVFYESSQ